MPKELSPAHQTEKRSGDFARNTEQARWLSPGDSAVKNGERWKHQLGMCIREQRILLGWTQRELADRLQQAGFARCGRSLLSQIEIGAASIRGEEIYYFRTVFGPGFEQAFWKLYDIRKVKEPESSSRGGAAS